MSDFFNRIGRLHSSQRDSFGLCPSQQEATREIATHHSGLICRFIPKLRDTRRDP